MCVWTHEQTNKKIIKKFLKIKYLNQRYPTDNQARFLYIKLKARYYISRQHLFRTQVLIGEDMYTLCSQVGPACFSCIKLYNQISPNVVTHNSTHLFAQDAGGWQSGLCSAQQTSCWSQQGSLMGGATFKKPAWSVMGRDGLAHTVGGVGAGHQHSLHIISYPKED